MKYIDYENDVIIYDLETLPGCFLASFFIPSSQEWLDFYVSEKRNDLDALIKFFSTNSDKYFVGYNNLRFDSQVIEYILENAEKWYDATNLEVSRAISKFASDIIEDMNYGGFPKWREESLSFKQIDLPCIWHFFNENRRVSLKQLEFEVRSETIESFDVDLKKEEFTDEEIDSLTKYCHNDILNTYTHYLYTIGFTDHPLYKGKNKIKDREIIIEEIGLPCLNWDDVKIGAEWNRKDYLELSGKSEKELRPKSVNHFYGKKYKKFFPSTVEFQSEEVKSFVEKIGETYITNEKQEFEHTFNKDLTIRIARGGIHSKEKNRYLTPTQDELYLQNDIGSQYPNALRKYGTFPKHLGKEWNDMLRSKIQRRLEYKSLYKKTKDPKYNSLQEMGKLALNGGAYGRLNTTGDWQEDPCAMLQVTMGCQLEILMIVEALLLKGFRVVSINTDGWDSIVPKERLSEYFEIVKFYEEKIGNKELGNVEYTVFDWIAQTSVNDYIAKKIGIYENGAFIEDVGMKLKGDFDPYKELHKNSSFNIIPLAFEKYFAEGVEPEDFVMAHDDIFDFCARSNAGKTYYHEGYKNNKSFAVAKLIRYYVSKEGIYIKKIVRDEVETNANDTSVQPSDRVKTICNFLPKEDYQTHLDNIDREWYISKIKETIFAVLNGRKPKRFAVDKNQTSLF